MAALDMDGQFETNKSPASTQHAGLFLEGASSPSHKKRHCLSAMSSLGPFGLLTKKDIAFRRCLLWVPGRTRTVDIQNHNLNIKIPWRPCVYYTFKELNIYR